MMHAPPCASNLPRTCLTCAPLAKPSLFSGSHVGEIRYSALHVVLSICSIRGQLLLAPAARKHG